MEDLGKAVEDTFRIPLTCLPIPDIPLVRILENVPLYGTEAARERPFLIQADIDDFLAAPRSGYFQIGFWGHGVNSYAFYYVRDAGRSRLLFRLPYGGAYMDNRAAAAKVGRFLPAFFRFEAEQIRDGASVLAVDFMGEGRYQIVDAGGGIRAYDRALFHNQAFFDGGLDFAAFLSTIPSPDPPSL